MPKARERRVFRGKIFSIYQWKQRLYDGSYATWERANRASTVQIIPTVGKKIVIAREEQPLMKPMLGMLGGMIDPGERPLAAAKRELLEESGLASGNWKLVKKFEYRAKVRYNMYLYIAAGCRKVAGQSLDPGEKISVRYVTLARLMSLVKTIRTGDDVRVYLMEAKYEPRMRKKFESLLFKER